MYVFPTLTTNWIGTCLKVLRELSFNYLNAVTQISFIPGHFKKDTIYPAHNKGPYLFQLWNCIELLLLSNIHLFWSEKRFG